jgi:hypothetical protein
LIPEEEETIPLVMAWTVISELFGIELNPNKTQKEKDICSNMIKYLCPHKN